MEKLQSDFGSKQGYISRHVSGGVCRFLIKHWRVPSTPPAHLFVSQAESPRRSCVARHQNERITASHRLSLKWLLISGRRKSIQEKLDSLPLLQPTLPASIRLLSLHTEAAEKFNYLSPTSLNLLSSLGQTYELEFLSSLKRDVGPAGCCRGDEVCLMLSTGGS